MQDAPEELTPDRNSAVGTVVVKSITLPPRVRLFRAGISLVKDRGLWWVTPSDNPDFRVGDGFKTKARAQKEALSSLRIVETGK